VSVIAALMLLSAPLATATSAPTAAATVAASPAGSVPQAPSAEAQVALAQLENGLDQLEHNDIEAALTTLEAAVGPFTLDDLLRRQEGLGIALAFAGRGVEAERAFGRLLAVAPGYSLPYTISPKATFVFERARAQMSKRRATEVRLQAPAALPFDLEVPLRATCEANVLDLVARWELCHRLKSGDDAYSCQDFTAAVGESVELSLPSVPAAAAIPDPSGAGEPRAILQLAVAGFDAGGNEVYRGPSRARPQELAVGAELPPLWYTNVWLWSSVGVGLLAVTAGAVTAAVLLQPSTARVVGEVAE